MAPAIPDRWTNYKPIGKQIEGTRFIAFKVPLRESISNNVAIGDRLDGRMLLKKVPNLGLIIDLTNTYRFYDPTVFENKGVNYKKIMIPGHETPTRQLTDKFISAVKEFIANNKDNDKLIGVHCTHGVNRTGYLICNYMISQMNINPNEAMDRFANFRGHKIERKNYIQALTKLTKTNTEDWRKRKSDDPPYSRRENRDHSKYRWKNVDRHDDRSRDIYSSWRRSPPCPSSTERYRNDKSTPSLHYSRESETNTAVSYRPSDRMDNEPQRNFSSAIPNEDQANIRKTTPYKPPHLRIDYYNKRPDDDRQRCTYIRKGYDS